MPLKGHAGEVFNVGSGNCVSVQDIADAISDNQTYIPKRPGEMNVTYANISKIASVLGWMPEIDVLEWISPLRDLKWMKEDDRI